VLLYQSQIKTCIYRGSRMAGEENITQYLETLICEKGRDIDAN
jgi:hypothetical protein